jgi:hypothetical protein
MSTPPSENLVYKYWESEYDHVLATRVNPTQDLPDKGWYHWDINGDLFIAKVTSSEIITVSDKGKIQTKYQSEVHAIYLPEGYTSSIMDIYYEKNGYLYKKYHDFPVPGIVPEKKNDWTAYHKTIDDYYNYWEKGKPPKKEGE